jgi:hypothetical protein
MKFLSNLLGYPKYRYKKVPRNYGNGEGYQVEKKSSLLATWWPWHHASDLEEVERKINADKKEWTYL